MMTPRKPTFNVSKDGKTVEIDGVVYLFRPLRIECESSKIEGLPDEFRQGTLAEQIAFIRAVYENREQSDITRTLTETGNLNSRGIRFDSPFTRVVGDTGVFYSGEKVFVKDFIPRGSEGRFNLWQTEEDVRKMGQLSETEVSESPDGNLRGFFYSTCYSFKEALLGKRIFKEGTLQQRISEIEENASEQKRFKNYIDRGGTISPFAPCPVGSSNIPIITVKNGNPGEYTVSINCLGDLILFSRYSFAVRK